MTAKTIVLALAMGMSVGGCVSLGEAPPAPAIHDLRAAAAPQAGSGSADVIAIARPNAPQALSGLDIAWQREGRIAYLPDQVWTARAPEALQSLLIETLDLQGRVRAAVRLGEGPRADFDLRWELYAFQVVEDADGLTAVIVTTATLVRAPSRAVIAARRFEARAPLAERSASAAVAALRAVAREAAGEIAVWAADAAAAQADDQPSAASISK